MNVSFFREDCIKLGWGLEIDPSANNAKRWRPRGETESED